MSRQGKACIFPKKLQNSQTVVVFMLFLFSVCFPVFFMLYCTWALCSHHKAGNVFSRKVFHGLGNSKAEPVWAVGFTQSPLLHGLSWVLLIPSLWVVQPLVVLNSFLVLWRQQWPWLGHSPMTCFISPPHSLWGPPVYVSSYSNLLGLGLSHMLSWRL